MYKILTVVCVLALLAIGTSVIATVVQRSDVSRQSQEIARLNHDEVVLNNDITHIQAELKHTNH